MTTDSKISELASFENRVEACRVELDDALNKLLDRGYSGQVLIAAMLREAILGTLRLHELKLVDSAFLQRLVDRVAADTAKARGHG